MASTSEILHRFRFHGVPGAPSNVAVPLDRSRQVESELAPVMSSIESAQSEARQLIEQAKHLAAKRRQDADEQARLIVEQGRLDAEKARQDSVAKRIDEAESQC